MPCAFRRAHGSGGAPLPALQRPGRRPRGPRHPPAHAPPSPAAIDTPPRVVCLHVPPPSPPPAQLPAHGQWAFCTKEVGWPLAELVASSYPEEGGREGVKWPCIRHKTQTRRPPPTDGQDASRPTPQVRSHADAEPPPPARCIMGACRWPQWKLSRPSCARRSPTPTAAAQPRSEGESHVSKFWTPIFQSVFKSIHAGNAFNNNFINS